MASFHQKIDNVKDSLASLFKSRRSRHRSRTYSSSSSGGGGGGGGGISTPQNVKRVMHVTFDAQKRSFDGIPADWRPYFDAAAAAAATASTVYEELTTEESRDDSGVSMATGVAAAAAASPSVEPPVPPPPATPPSPPPPPPPPKELLSLTYDRNCGKFVDLPNHWRERLQRNNLLAPEFQSNPDLLVAIFALMDEELRAMRQEGFSLDKAMYSSSPTLEDDSQQYHYVYEIEADSSNSSSEQSLLPAAAAASAAAVDNDDSNLAESPHHHGVRTPSLVRMRAVSAPSAAMKLP